MNVGGITDRLVRLSRDAGRPLPGRRWRRSTSCCRSSSPASRARRPPTRRARARSSSRRRSRKATTCRFSVAITAVSAVLAVIIPPSILMIVWGGVLTVSIGALFLAGIIPGLLIGLAQMATVHVYAKLRNYPTYPRATLQGVRRRRCVSVPALMTPVIIVGGKISRLVHRDRVGGDRGALRRGAVDLRLPRDERQQAVRRRCSTPASSPAVALFCVGTASAPSAGCSPTTRSRRRCSPSVGAWGMGIIGDRLLHRLRVPRRRLLPRRDPGDHHRRHDPAAARRSRSHMDPVHFAIIGIVSLAFGLVTPPYGLCLMISLRDRQGAPDVRAEGRDDHADADARRARLDDRLAGDRRCSCRG